MSQNLIDNLVYSCSSCQVDDVLFLLFTIYISTWFLLLQVHGSTINKVILKSRYRSYRDLEENTKTKYSNYLRSSLFELQFFQECKLTN